MPDARALATARTHALALLTEQVLLLCGSDLAAAQQHLSESAARAGDDATRYVVLEQAVGLAERVHALAPACQALAVLAREFAIDRDLALRDLLLRMSEDGGTPAAAVAITALQSAQRAALRPDAGPMHQLHDVALRAGRQSADAWLLASLTGELDLLDELHATWSLWCNGDVPADDRPARAQLFEQLCLCPERLAPVALRRLADLLPAPLDARLAGQTVAAAGPERLLTLSQRVGQHWLRRSLQRAARQLLGSRLNEAGDDAERGVRARQLAGITALLADQDGITRLRFRAAHDLGQLVFTRGKWRIEDGMLVGATDGENNFATHRHAFADIRSVVIRGGIRSPAGLNFRLAVGDVNIIFNWEVAPQNHLWSRGEQLTTAPPALTPGQQHTIALHATDAGVLVFVDDRLWFTTPGALAGTVCIYPALGSEIFVREILVDGELECSGPVAGPRGEPK